MNDICSFEMKQNVDLKYLFMNINILCYFITMLLYIILD
jgi:hypothetical protein